MLISGGNRTFNVAFLIYRFVTQSFLTNMLSHYFHFSLCLLECLNEIWKGDMGINGSEEDSEGKDGKATHDVGEL